jgi:predicted DNA-binding transcriptional regulator AlpA
MLPKDSPDTLLITYRDVASSTGLALGTLYAMVSRGTIPHIRARPREIARWLADHSVASSPEEVA